MKEMLEANIAQLKSAVDHFPWTDRRAYGDWLAQTYYYVRHSTRLLAGAAAQFPHDERGDKLHYRFATHIAEEKRHERLALHDLQRLGLTLDAFPERHATRMFYETQYFKIEHEAPAVLFGYILPLEAIGPAMGPNVITRVTAAFGDKCDTAFLRVHAADDEDHLQKALTLIETVTGAERRLLVRNLEQTTYAYCNLLRDIVEQPA
jgi:pyrroloquinoline quinone (PQQ) biosynthesis protein C